MKWCGHHFLLRQLFSKACPDIFYADFHIAERFPQHGEYHNTSTLSMNVAIMLWRCFLTTCCGNGVATLLKLSWNVFQQLHVPTFSQLSLNVVAMFLQLSSMTLRQHQVGTFSVAQHLSNVPGLRCGNVSWHHFHNFRSTLWQRSRNFPGIRWCNVICKRFPNFH